MIFLFVLFYCGIYFYFVDKYKMNVILLTPPFLVYFFISALQYNVGSDYMSYIFIYENQWVMDRYYNTREYFFYFTNIILNSLNLPPQAVFFVFSFVQSLFVFIYFSMFKKRGGVLWLFFIIFFCVTNIYHNQMNGIRQYSVIALVPLVSLLLFERKYVLLSVVFLLASTFHLSFFVLFLFIILYLIYLKFNVNYLFCFIVTLPIYIFLPKVVIPFLELFDMQYLSYIDTDYFKEGGGMVVLPKLYYLPVILLFYWVNHKESFDSINERLAPYFSFSIFIFSCSYWAILMSLDIALLSRVAIYFWFFIVFPIYNVCIYLYKNSIYFFYLVLFYILLPYLAKVTFLAKNEYLYKSFIFN